jgi:alkanesulfonate monooxygenase
MLPFDTYSVLTSIGDKAHHLAPTYRESVATAARMADRFGYTGALLHYNFHGVDPWCLVPSVLEATDSLVPLVATPATAMPPHTLARHVAAMAALYGRAVAINVVTGANPAELATIGDTADHDGRYSRAEEHTRCFREMVRGEPVRSRPYDGFVLDPGVPAGLRPEIFLAGSSPAGLATAAKIADVAVTHAADPAAPETVAFLDAVNAAGLAAGIRLGIVARPTTEQAWRVVEERFPQDRWGSLMSMQKLRSESHWMRSLADKAVHGDQLSRLWFGAFAVSKSHAAYLVGDYDEVAAVLAEYRECGVTRLLLDGPYDDVEFEHTHEALTRVPVSQEPVRSR